MTNVTNRAGTKNGADVGGREDKGAYGVFCGDLSRIDSMALRKGRRPWVNNVIGILDRVEGIR